jgi:hypothetical protein
MEMKMMMGKILFVDPRQIPQGKNKVLVMGPYLRAGAAQ